VAGNLKTGIGDSETDSVLGAVIFGVCLAAIAERELKTPFLGREIPEVAGGRRWSI